MNERIEDLMYRAGLTAQGCWDEMDGYDRNAIQKFAELIVDECVLKLLAMDEKAKGNHNYYKHAALEVKRHFNENNPL